MTAALKRKRDETSDTVNNKRRELSFYDDKDKDGTTSSADDTDELNSDEEEEDWAGFQNEADEVVHDPGTSDISKKPTVLPSGHDMRVMKEATELYKSNSFKLKIDSLLPTVRPKYESSAASNLEFVLRKLREFILSIPVISPLHPLEASAQLLRRSVAVSYCQPRPTEETNWMVSFETPVDVKLVGSWANKLAVKAKDGVKFCVDVGVEMPDTLFQEKDYLNARFFHKRAFYIATIAAALQEEFPVNLSYHSTFNDPRLTTLILQSRKDQSKYDFYKLNTQIRIIPILRNSSPISLRHLSPSRCNIRISTSSHDLPTPHYNSALMLCLTPIPHLILNFNLKNDIRSFTDSLTLLRVWANQRGYGDGTLGWNIDGFEDRGTFWSTLLALLTRGEESVKGNRKKLNSVGKGLSSYQLFKAALGFLARHDFEKEPVYVKGDGGLSNPDEYEAHHESVFVDSSGTVNIVHGIPINSLRMLQHDARITLESLDNNSHSDDSFSETFLQEQRDLSTRFDLVIQVDLSSAKPKCLAEHDILDTGSAGKLLLSTLASTLSRGLGSRIKALAILHRSSSTRPVAQALPFTPSTIQIGLVLNSEHAFRLVDHGPSAEVSEADPSFRNFWGDDKAELRRFKDGKIIESVVWDIKNVDEKARIPFMIVSHILKRHFAIDESAAISTWQSSFDSVLRAPPEVSRIYDRFVPKVGFKMAIAAFDALVKQIKGLSDLPLAILSVNPVSEYLRYTSVFTPVGIPTTALNNVPLWMQYLPMIDIILEFEKSSRWPDDLAAIQKMKLAFFEQIARSITTAEKGAKASIVIGDVSFSSDIEDQAKLEIITPEGWGFSIRIWHDREATLLDRVTFVETRIPKRFRVNQDSSKAKEKHDAAKAKGLYLSRFVHAPKHHRAVLNICHRYTAYAGTARLLKRWLACHWLLGEHVSPEAVELICAKIYIGDGKKLREDLSGGQDDWPGVPVSKERGFAQVIKFLMDWRWEDGLVIPIYGSPEPINLDGATAGSGAWRLFTEEDPTGRMWTRSGPDAVVARRVTSMAKATWYVLQQGVNMGKLDMKTIYSHPTADYDLVIELDAVVLPRSHQNIFAGQYDWITKSKYANIGRSHPEENRIRPGFDPAQFFLEDLKRVYADTMLFFSDPYGGNKIGGIWLPSLETPRQFRALGGFSSTPLPKTKGTGKGLVVLNKSGILAEIRRMGHGLIKQILIQKE